MPNINHMPYSFEGFLKWYTQININNFLKLTAKLNSITEFNMAPSYIIILLV